MSVESLDQVVDPAQLGLEQDGFTLDLEEELLGHAALERLGAATAVHEVLADEASSAARRSRSTTSWRSRLCASASAIRNSAG